MKAIEGIIIRIAITSVLLFSMGNAQATLVIADWKTIGDELITRNTDTDLEWLDLTLTDNQSYNTVLQRLIADLTGWRVGTAEEVEALFFNLGLPLEDSFGPNPSVAAAVREMTHLLGNTFSDYFTNPTDGQATGIFGFVDFSIFDGFHLQKGAFIDEAGVFSSVNPPYDGQRGDVLLYTANRDGHGNDNLRFRHMGTFLARSASAIPEPASIFLIVIGILGLIAVRRCPYLNDKQA